MITGSDVFNQKGDILSKIQSLLSVLDIAEVHKKRENANQWKSLFSDLRDTFGNISENQVAFLIVLIKLIKAKSQKDPKSESAQEKNFRAPQEKQKSSEKQKEKSEKRAKRKKRRQETMKSLNNAMDSEYARILGVIIKQAISNVLPKIPEMIVEEILRAFDCDLSTEIPVSGDGLEDGVGTALDIILRVDQVDLFKQLKVAPDVGVGKYYYEAASFDLGLYPPGKSPFSMNRFFYYLMDVVPNTPKQVYGASGKILFTIEFDSLNETFVINPHYKSPNIPIYTSTSPSTPGGGTKFTVAEFLRDYFDNIKVLELQNILGALMEITAGLGFSVTNDGEKNIADILGINKFIGILNRIMASCDGMDLGVTSTGAIDKMSQLLDDDGFYNFNTEEEQNFYLEAVRKSKGVIKFESCDDIEIPLDPIIFQDAATEIMATLNQGGDGIKDFLLVCQTGVEGSMAKMPDPAFRTLDWNWNLHFMEKLIIQFPQIIMLALMSTKVILPIILVAKIVNNNTLLAASPAEFAKLFKRVFVRICRAILGEVVKIIFKILKQFLTKLLILYVKMLMSRMMGKRMKMILSLINALLPFINELQNAQNCKEILMIILRMIEATGIDVPFPPPPKFLLFAANARRGTNPLSTFEKLIGKLEALGIHTGDMPDGSPNEWILGKYAELEAMDEEKTINEVVHSVLFPTIATGPIGAMVVQPTKCVGVTC